MEKRRQDKWDEKNGLISKTYKLKKDTVYAFKEACEKAEVSQSKQLMAMMNEFIKKVSE